ncbi:hypothetical protein BKA62DRAFT_671068 [Auriculariales sp. MPI-PUGE-AT-0066]|nr:hypothetical protein BKA62DRAFT_671068 [Auriculariales sp. MPI-PUGE-AT-0066]
MNKAASKNSFAALSSLSAEAETFCPRMVVIAEDGSTWLRCKHCQWVVRPEDMEHHSKQWQPCTSCADVPPGFDYLCFGQKQELCNGPCRGIADRAEWKRHMELKRVPTLKPTTSQNPKLLAPFTSTINVLFYGKLPYYATSSTRNNRPVTTSEASLYLHDTLNYRQVAH